MAQEVSRIKLHQHQKLSTYQSLARWMWRAAIGGIVGLILYLIVLSFSTPSFKQLEDPNYSLASEILAANGEVIGRYYIENRVPVPYDSLSDYLIQALIATEDERFSKHAGIDPRALGRVLYGLVTLSPKGGGSTITQQLAKLLYSSRDFEGMNKIEKSFALVSRKLSEWITAVKLEKNYTKEEILSMYLNKADFINGAFGIKAAAEVYFGKPQDSLRIEEAATLIGMLQNPSLYNPVRRAEKAKNRRNIVLQQMVRNKMITEEECTALMKSKLDMSRFKTRNSVDGMAPYFRQELLQDVLHILAQKECLKPDGTQYDIYRDGLTITTTIDPEMQRLAEAAMREHMADIQKRFFTVWKGRDPWTYRNPETTEDEIRIRQRTLERLIRETERYQVIRDAYMSEVVDQVRAEFNYRVDDSDMERMIEEEKKDGFIISLIAKKYATPEQAAVYRRIMASDYWQVLKMQWRKVQADAKKQFNTPVKKMRVFAYNEKMEKDTTMTPLDSLKYHRMFLQMGSMAIDPRSGAVKTWVGGCNFRYFQYDHIRNSRQVGSTFKPFVYATAIDQKGISPCYTVYDVPQTISPGEGFFRLSKSWTPKNAGSYSGRNYTLQEALKESVNTVSVYLMKELGNTEPVRGLINNMGIDSSTKFPNGQYRVPKQPSICLGATDLSVFEMTGAYGTFANNGLFTRPYFISQIQDKNGRVIYRNIPEERQALPPNSDYVMVHMLKYAAKGAPGISDLKSDVGGKTGTTNDFTDGWFMGITPQLVVGTWVGGEDRWIRFLNIADGQGSRMARPFFAKFMKKIETSTKVDYDPAPRFLQPPGDLGIEIDCAQYRKQAGGSPDAAEFFEDQFSDEAPAPPPPPEKPNGD